MGRNPFFGYRTPTDDQKLNGLLSYQFLLTMSIFIFLWTCTKPFTPHGDLSSHDISSLKMKAFSL